MTTELTTKEKISRAAIGLIAARGVDAVSMRDIAREVGVSEAAIYRHFPNKSELIWEVFAANYDSFAGRLFELQEPHPDLKEKLSAMIGACCDLFDCDCELFTFLLLAQHIQRSAPRDYQAALPDMLKSLLLTSMERGEIPEQDPDVTAAMIMGAVLQTALYCLYQKPHPRPMTPLSDTLSSACFRLTTGD